MRKWNELQLRFELEGFDEVEGDATERAISQEEARQISEGAWREFEQLTKVSGRPVDLSIGEEGDGKGWFREYVRLREQGWPWRVGAYMAWAASPKNRRWPESIQDLATKVLGLKGPRVIYQWRHKYPAIDAVVAMMQAAPLFEHRRDVLEALVTMARTPDYKSFNDRKLFLEMVGDYVPKSQVGVGVSARDLSELSDEELDGLLGGQGIMKTGETSEGRRKTEVKKVEKLERFETIINNIKIRDSLPNETLEKSIKELGLGTFIENSLYRAGIVTIGEVLELIARGYLAILDIRQFGDKSARKLIKKLIEKDYLDKKISKLDEISIRQSVDQNWIEEGTPEWFEILEEEEGDEDD